ncbi:hypothetical protein QR680_011443 [Steinernema hermaphroditum]|uniref:G-protein coupled receptors family 1 profile domain-containing protein n=1 Tax=Steinernema hermaphroditum TaxID=289476 RepID=A0AA39I096_9BILA|nr:hypothetical protein QR680_011443 [Steinernema hermaphroditum]
MATLDEHISISIIRLFIMIVSILGNLLILFVIFQHRKLRKTGANILLAQLAFADLIIGIATGIRGISAIIFENRGISVFDKGICLIIGSPTVFGIHLSQTTMVAIAFDRLMCVRFPMMYRKMETSLFALLRFFICFGYSLFGTGITYIGFPSNESIHVCSTGNSVPMWYRPYYSIFGNSVTVAMYIFYILIYIMFNRQKQSSKRAAQRTIFATITAVLVSYFFLCFIPNVTVVIGTIKEGNDPNSDLAGYIALFVGLGNGINASLNVFIYGWKHKELRVQLLKYRILSCLLCRFRKQEFTVTAVTVISKVKPSTK